MSVLKRWMNLDRALASAEGVHVYGFAKECRCDDRTIRRDLQVFRKLGKRMVVFNAMPGRRVGGKWRWRYAAGIEPLFR